MVWLWNMRILCTSGETSEPKDYLVKFMRMFEQNAATKIWLETFD